MFKIALLLSVVSIFSIPQGIAKDKLLPYNVKVHIATNLAGVPAVDEAILKIKGDSYARSYSLAPNVPIAQYKISVPAGNYNMSGTASLLFGDMHCKGAKEVFEKNKTYTIVLEINHSKCQIHVR